jgi:DnaK suppressor protein
MKCADMNLEKFRKLLDERKKEIQVICDQNKQSAEAVELDQSRVGRVSRMDSLQVQAMALETNRRNAIELRKIEAALKRIGNGDYGYCLECDEMISEGRLEIDPAVTLCIDCASKNEQ